MSSLSFEIDYWSLMLLLLFGALLMLAWRWSLQFGLPHLLFSDLQDLRSAPKTWRVPIARLSQWLGYGTLTFFALAFIDPRFYAPREGDLFQTPTKGIAIYFVLDQSGSMKENVITTLPTGEFAPIKKTDLLKLITTDFIQGNPKIGLQGRPNDLTGLIFFARTAHIISPLTLDHKAILQDLSKFEAVKSPDEDGTAIGYAIYKTANLIAATRHYAEDLAKDSRPAYDIKNAIVILVTDGSHDPNPLDDNNPLRSIGILEAAQYAKEKGVKVYVVNVEPAFASEKLAPNRRQMEQAAQMTGGQFYLMDQSTSLNQIYSDIDKLEKSILPTNPLKVSSKDEIPNLYQRISLYPYLIVAGMLLLALSVLAKTTLLRQLP